MAILETLSSLASIVFWVFLTWLVITVLNKGALDSTDNHITGERSGLIIYMDHGTGCQYIKGGVFGGLTPRVDKDGNHICVTVKSEQ